jgi:hypothetical protein
MIVSRWPNGENEERRVLVAKKPSPGELSVVIVAENHNPSILNPDFLLRNGIVKEEWHWDLAKPPISTQPFSQVVFKSGFSITAHFDRLVFTEAEEGNIPTITELAHIVCKYVETLPHVAYRSVGINPTCHVIMESEDASRLFIVDTFVRKGPWSDFGDAPLRASVRFVFQANGAKLLVTIDEAQVKTSGEEKPAPRVMFQGNFHRDLEGKDAPDKLSRLVSIIQNWSRDYDLFVGLVQERFIR